MKYDIDYFIEFFSNIARSKWTTQSFNNSKEQKCAIGHCGVRSKKDLALRKIISPSDITRSIIPVTSINDGQHEYRKLGKHPRTRILRALKNIKKKGKIL